MDKAIGINEMIKRIELAGTACGVLGAFLAACKMGNFGYPLFFISSCFLCYTAIKQGNKNLVVLQGTFLAANIVGLFNFL